MKFTIIVINIFLLSGCIGYPAPYEYWETPTYRGRVFDSTSKKPLSEVVIKSKNYPSNKTKTNTKGYFEMKPVKSIRIWKFFYFVPADGFCRANVEVSLTGYQTEIVSKGQVTPPGMDCTGIDFYFDVYLKKQQFAKTDRRNKCASWLARTFG